MHLKYAINIIKVMLFMRDPIEKKTVNMSLKMTESLRTHLKEQAAEKGTSFNNFVLSKLEHDENVTERQKVAHESVAPRGSCVILPITRNRNPRPSGGVCCVPEKKSR